MRAITVRQPWGWAIVHGGKDVENRTRSLGPYRGPVAIHAGLALDEGAIDDFTLRRAWHLAGMPTMPSTTPGIALPWLRHWNIEDDEQWLPTGAVIGVVDLVDVHHVDACWKGGHDDVRGWWQEMCSPWAQDDHHHLVLANPRPLARPIPWRGQLSLWTVPDDLEAAIREQVAL